MDDSIKRVTNPGRYFWCVDCGHRGDYGYRREAHFICLKCNYDLVTVYEREEILEDPHLMKKFPDVK